MTFSTWHNRTRIAIRLYSGKLLLTFVFLGGSDAVIHGQHVTKQADARAFYVDDPIRIDPDRINITEPTEFPLYKDADYLINSFTHPGGDAGPALNVNSVDDVPDSSWFTNRILANSLSVEEAARGPLTGDGPAPGVWTIIRPKSSGFSPGARRSMFTSTWGPDAIERLLTNDLRTALQTSCISASKSGRPFPTGVPGTFSKLVMK